MEHVAPRVTSFVGRDDIQRNFVNTLGVNVPVTFFRVLTVQILLIIS